MPHHTALHREAAVDKKIRDLGIHRLRQIESQKATQKAIQQEKDQRTFRQQSGWTK